MSHQQERRAASRVIHHVDQGGHVLRIQHEPAGDVAARQICVAQVLELMRRANELLVTLQYVQVPAAPRCRLTTPTRRVGWAEGYRAALDHVQSWPELEALAAAVQDLRPYLAIIARDARQGELFPRPVIPAARWEDVT